MAHLTIAQLEQHLADIGAGKHGPDVTYAYVEVGRYKPYSVATVKAAERRGYKVERRGAVYYIYPKAVAPVNTPVVKAVPVVSPQQVTVTEVNGHKAAQLELTVRKGAFSYARSAIGKMPAPDKFSWLMGILEGWPVFATAFSGTNVVGHTSEAQLRHAYSNMSADNQFYIKEPQLEAVIAEFGDGTLGFHMGGMYCEQTPAQIAEAIAPVFGA